jgi:DNA-binding MarR family transcriptional regulator
VSRGFTALFALAEEDAHRPVPAWSGLVERSESGAAGRRTGIALTGAGREVAEGAIEGHGRNLRRLVLDRLAPDQAAAIGAWSRQIIEPG